MSEEGLGSACQPRLPFVLGTPIVRLAHNLPAYSSIAKLRGLLW